MEPGGLALAPLSGPRDPAFGVKIKERLEFLSDSGILGRNLVLEGPVSLSFCNRARRRK